MTRLHVKVFLRDGVFQVWLYGPGGARAVALLGAGASLRAAVRQACEAIGGLTSEVVRLDESDVEDAPGEVRP